MVKTTMPLRIEMIGIDDKQILENLLQFYLHEKCKYDPQALSESGRFQYDELQNYFNNAGHTPYFIRVKGRLAGFVLLKQIESHGKTVCHAITEFFILEPYRKLGIGEEIARTIFDEHPGSWQIHAHADNKGGREFLFKVLYRYTGNKFRTTPLPGVNGPVFTFISPGPRVTEPTATQQAAHINSPKPETI